MKLKYILLCLLFINICSADSVYYQLNPDGTGTFSASLAGSGTLYSTLMYINNVDYTHYNMILYSYYPSGSSNHLKVRINYGDGWGKYTYCVPHYLYEGDSCKCTLSKASFNNGDAFIRGEGLYGTSWTMNSVIYVTAGDINDYTISGVLGCISNVNFYIKDNIGVYTLMGSNSSGTSYEFDTIEGITYKLVFSDGHEYEFACTGDVTYDRDVCSFSSFNIYDNCDNLITGSYGYYNSDDGTYTSYLFEGPSFDVPNVGQTYIDIIVHNFEGTLEYHIDNPLPNTEITYSLLNPGIQWINTIWVYDAIESHLLNDALVTLSQDCIIDTSLHPTRNRYTDAGGYACFSQCGLDSASLAVSLTGYQSYNGYIGIGAMDAFNQSQLIMIKLYPYDDESNSSHYEFTDFTTSIYFKDNSSRITSTIYDTDEYVDLYYHNNNTLGSSMVLSFDMGIAGTFNSYNTVLTWLIPAQEAGYKRIFNDNFSNHLNYYRATLTNSEIDGWDKLKYLNVINETNEVVYHYENLSSNVWFAGAVNNKIEYKEDISINAYANSNNSTLLNVSLELYNETNMLEYINLTWADFSDPADRWMYRWLPIEEYEKNKNYTVKMYGFNYQFLKDDSVYTTDLHKNKLTIRVIDESGDYLTDAYVFLDGYGSLSTGSTFYNSYQGLDDGEYLYKATKLDYTGRGWESVNLSDAYKIVNYTLTSSEGGGDGDITHIHFSDTDLQSIFYPLMFFLLMCILLGGLKYVAK